VPTALQNDPLLLVGTPEFGQLPAARQCQSILERKQLNLALNGFLRSVGSHPHWTKHIVTMQEGLTSLGQPSSPSRRRPYSDLANTW